MPSSTSPGSVIRRLPVEAALGAKTVRVLEMSQSVFGRVGPESRVAVGQVLVSVRQLLPDVPVVGGRDHAVDSVNAVAERGGGEGPCGGGVRRFDRRELHRVEREGANARRARAVAAMSMTCVSGLFESGSNQTLNRVGVAAAT